jgi:tetratricopeptide (TPR) repeat protein/class 3 adenylate cyclase
MTPLEEWPRIKMVLEGALACEGAARDAYLARACGPDAAMRARVERLLAAQDRAEAFLEIPAAALLGVEPEGQDLSGRTVGSYCLGSSLGAGGMGEVYRAHDLKLDRPVAIKFLSRDLADRDRLLRFAEEARAASSLNHPHIVVVHDVGELEGRPYIVTELVEGETLRERISRGPLPASDVVEIALQVGSALAAAHAKGLVHRDIKPDNVMLRPDGYVKVLDFGVAKRVGGDGDTPGRQQAPRTHPAALIGTPHYMSPEQARGGNVDARSDVWSLGVVLYEMLSGGRPFDGPSSADVLTAVLGADPPLLDDVLLHPFPALARVVEKALRKDRLDRYVDAEEMLADLRRLSSLVARDLVRPDQAAAVPDDEPTLGATGERRRVTVLVTQVSNYAALVERLAPADVEGALRRIRAAAVDTMRRHGGVVNQSIGEEIVSLFGIPAAHEDDDLRAVRAAIELNARVREIGAASDPSGARVRLQSGVHSGSAVAQRLREGPRRYAVTGPPAQIAAHLAATADADTILVSADCQRVLAPFVRTEPGARIVVHADAPPVATYCVLGESGLESRLEAAALAGLTPYTGRTQELNAVRAQVALARDGEGRVIVVVGDAGAGKSRLLHELRSELAGSVRVLHGRCRSFDGATSYLPFIEALYGALGVKDADGGPPTVTQLVDRIRAIEPSLEPFIPLYLHLLPVRSNAVEASRETGSEAFPLPRHLRGEHFQAAMLEALAAFFTSFTQSAPVLLLLEDWHWADAASRQALRRVAELVAAYPLGIVVTTRPEPGTLVAPAEQTIRIDLRPLDFTASLAIINAVLTVERVPDALARVLHDRTGGNPFFLEEMCHALREGGIVTARGGEAVPNGSVDTLQLPDTVQAVIRSRLDRLPADAREVLRVASVIGREFPRRILCEVLGAAHPDAAIDALKNAGIVQQIRVVPDLVYRFKHVLTQEVTYDSLVTHQRQTLHQKVGRAIERCESAALDQHLEVLAYHFSRAETWDDAIEYGMRAASRAGELSQLADALDILDRVTSWLMHLSDDAPRRDRLADVLLRQERLCETLGLRGRQLHLCAELIALLAPHGASPHLAEAYLRQGDVCTLLKRFDAADRALATALRMSREQGDAALERNALRSSGLLRWHQGRHAEALAITETALAIDRQRDDPLAFVGDLSNLGTILRSMGDYARALAVFEEALAMPVVAGDPIKRAYILHNIANIHRAHGDIRQALEFLQRANDSARRHMLSIQRSFHLTSIAHIHLQEGRLVESLQLYHEAVDLSRRARHADGLAQALRMLGEVLFAIGRDREALGHLQEAAQLFGQIEDRESETAMRRHVAVVLERLGEADASAAWECVRTLAQSGGDARAELDALEGIARAGRRQASADAIGRFEEALALASRLGDTRREAALRNTLGIMHWEGGAYQQALAHYETALGLTRIGGDRVHEGLMLNSIGVTLSALRRYEEARTALEEALVVNRETGEQRLEAHTLGSLGDVAQAVGRFEAAAEYFEASLAVRRELGDPAAEGSILPRLAAARARSSGTSHDDAHPAGEKEGSR